MQSEGSEEALRALPPLPVPKYNERRWQCTGGCAVVLTQIAINVGIVHAAIAIPKDFPERVATSCLVITYSEACVALLCLLAIICSDPGVVPRTLKTCFPQPPEVAKRLAAGDPLSDLRNIEDEAGDRSFCVRCLVWRDVSLAPSSIDRFFYRNGRAPKPHHCRVCERCVLRFDHHCGVFGRCIAGNGWTGNMGFFLLILTIAAIAGTTTSATVVIAVAVAWESDSFEISASVAIPVGIVAAICLCSGLVRFAIKWCIFVLCRYRSTRTDDAVQLQPVQSSVPQAQSIGAEGQ